MTQQSNLPARTNTVNSVQELLKKHKNQFAMVLPKSLSVDRLMRIVLSTVTINPKLLQCEQKSFLRSVLQSASLGLEPGGPLGLAHLVPFWNGARNQFECQLIVDYKGYIALAHNSGEVGRIHAAIIYENEPWEWAKDGTLIHKPLPPSQRGEKKVMVFAKAFDKTGNLLAEKFLWAEEVEAIKTKVLGNKKNTALNPWNTAEESMWLKSPVRRLAKWMPMAAEMQKAAVIEEYQEEGITPVLDVDLDMGEAPQATDAEQKTDEKANALREKLKQAQGQNKTGAPAGTSGQHDGPDPGVEGARATPEPPTLTPGEVVEAEFLDDPGPTDPPPPAEENGPPHQETQANSAGGQEDPPFPPEPPTRPTVTSVVKQPSEPQGKKGETFGFSKGPRIEKGKKPTDYFLDNNMVKCPPGGEREGLLTAQKTYCDSTCKFRKRCFLFVE